ncbi:MAG: glycosyltransferase [Planctomycetales bacterium]|nr:glycosyltransferase [Planctomycetales bacterium]
MSDNCSQISGDGATPALSVLMTVFNDSPVFLKKAVDSVLGQTFEDFEFLILDDGSTEPRTIEALHRIAEMDARIRMQWEPHRGLTKTLNVGLSQCRAPLVCRHDADDWSSPDRFLRQIDFLSENDHLALVGSAVELCQENGATLWTQQLPHRSWEVLEAFPDRNPFCHGAICFRTDAARKIGGYNEAYNCSQDYDFTWRLSERFGGANLAEVLYFHRRNVASISSRKSVEQAQARFMAQYLAAQRAKGIPEDAAAALTAAIASVSASRGNTLLRAGDQELLSGHYAAALKCYLLSIIRTPFLARPYLKALRWFVFVLSPRRRASLFGH